MTKDRGWGRDNAPARWQRLLDRIRERLAKDETPEQRLSRLQKLLRTDVRLFGQEGKPTTLCRVDIADALDTLGRSDEALELRTQVVDACRSHAGAEDQQTLYARLAVARTLQKCGRTRDAQAEAAGVFEIGRRTCGTEHDVTKKAASMADNHRMQR